MAIELKDIEQIKYLGTVGHTSLAEAVITIGAVPTVLKVTNVFAVPNDLEVPENIIVTPSGKGGVNIAIGKHLKLNSANLDRRQLNVGPGMLSFGKNTLDEFFLSTWTGTADEVTLTAMMENGLWESIYQSSGGRVILPSAIINMLGGGDPIPAPVHFVGQGGSLTNTGTVIKPAPGSTHLFKFYGSGSYSKFERFCVDAGANTGINIFQIGKDPTNINDYFEHLDIEQIVFTGGKSHVWMDGGVNNTDMLIGVTVRKCFMFNADEVCVKVGTVNCGLTLADNNISPAWNRTSKGVSNLYGGIITWEGVNTINGRNFTVGDHHASFTDAAVNTATGVINLPGHRFINAGASAIDVEGLYLYNTGGALPTGWTPATIEYFVRYIDANNITLHTTAVFAAANTNKVIPSLAAGGGTHTARAITARHTRFLPSEVNLTTGVVIARGHDVPINEICACTFEGADLPLGWNPLVRYWFNPTSPDAGTIHATRYFASYNNGILIPTDQGSGIMTLKMVQSMKGERPYAAIETSGSTVVQVIKGVQEEGFRYALVVEQPHNYAASIVLADCIMQSVKLIKANVVIDVVRGIHNGLGFQDIPGISAIVYVNGARLAIDFATNQIIDIANGRLPQPGFLESFQGRSTIKNDRRPYRNNQISEHTTITLEDELAAEFPNEALLSIFAAQAGQPAIRYGYGSDGVIGDHYKIGRNGFVAGKIGWSRFWGSNPTYTGWDFDGPVELNGTLSNVKALPLAGGGTVTMDCGSANHFELPITGNVTINAIGMREQQIISLKIVTSGTTSFNVTFGTNFKSKGVLATGTVNDAWITILFLSDGVYVIEQGR